MWLLYVAQGVAVAICTARILQKRHLGLTPMMPVPRSYTSAVLEATLAPTQQPPQLWRDTMSEMARLSCEAYRKVSGTLPPSVCSCKRLAKGWQWLLVWSLQCLVVATLSCHA